MRALLTTLLALSLIACGGPEPGAANAGSDPADRPAAGVDASGDTTDAAAQDAAPDTPTDSSDTSNDASDANTNHASDADTNASDADARENDVPAPLDTDTADTAPDAPEPPCPQDMVLVTGFCMDRYEAPNLVGEPPLVMMSLLDAMAWCEARQKRVCFDDEWTQACAGDDGLAYPYGATRRPGVCNDDKLWRAYEQPALNGWPSAASGPAVASFADQIATARATSARAADHVQSLYQGSNAGENPGCAGEHEVFDLVGNVEEWTVRRAGGTANFHGALKGRYWAESRTCQSAVTTHGDSFRFYETGFRCCRDRR